MRKIVQISRLILNVHVAADANKRAQGLQNIKYLNSFDGMLFELGSVEDADFHMRNVKFPLDMLFIDEDMKIKKIYTAQPEEQSIKCNSVLYVLELNGGMCKRYKIVVGDGVTIL